MPVLVSKSQARMRNGLHLSWCATTDVGKVRRVNEDSYLALPGAYVVADGISGHQAGEIASKLVVEAIGRLIIDGLTDVTAIGRVIEVANESVRSHADAAGLEGMGSTLVGAFVVRNGDEDSLVVVNVGDSRCYSIVDGTMTLVTKDHSHVQELIDRGDITPEAALTHTERNIVTRAIGTDDVVLGDFYVVPSAPRGRLMLCSDGLSNELTFDHMRSLLNGHVDPADAVAALLGAFLSGSASDNATVIVVDVSRTRPRSSFADDGSDVTGPRPRPRTTGASPTEREASAQAAVDAPGEEMQR